MADVRIPLSAIHGMVNTAGDATHGPYIQLLNPGGSGVKLVIYELRLGCTKPTGTNRHRLRRTASPLTLGGTTTTATLFRRDETNAAAIVATLKGCTAVVGTIQTEAQSFWYDRISTDATAPYQELHLLTPLCFPITVVAGSAIEFVDPDVAAANNIRLYAVWDELPA